MSFGCTDACQRPVNNQCHCTACHHTFRHTGDFDRHLQGTPDRRIHVVPAGLVERAGIWATPESHEKASEAGIRLQDSRTSSSTTERLTGAGLGVVA